MTVNQDSKSHRVPTLAKSFANNPRRVSGFVTSEEGMRVQKQPWRELSGLLENFQPGIMQNI